jgi:hypothetical protein
VEYMAPVEGRRGWIMNTRDIALQMLSAELCPVPVAFRDKKPIPKLWQKLVCEDVSSRIDELFPFGKQLNVGCLLGEPSGGIVDIDLDWGIARQLAPRFLPPTRVFGRNSARGSHYLYYVGEGVSVPTERVTPPRKFTGEAKPDILEVRSDGAQTVWPGSIHTSGENIEWADENAQIAQVGLQELSAATSQLAAAAWLVSVWGEGSRDELATALAGALLRDGANEADVSLLLESVMTAAGDEEMQDRLKKVPRIATGLAEDNGRHYGWPKITELLGERESEWLKKLLQSMGAPKNADDSEADSPILLEMLDRLAVIKHGCQTFILYPESDPVFGQLGQERKRFDLMRASELKTFYLNKPVPIPGTHGKKFSNPVDVFLKHPERKTYKGIVFAPDGRCPEGFLNLWQGFSVEACAGDCGLYLTHVRDNIAAGNDEHYRWIIGWLADAVQNPGNKPGTALILRGGRGTGKGMMVKWFGRIFGQHFLPISKPGLVTGRFTGHLADASIVFADEAFFAGNKAEEAALKALITEDSHMIEHTGKDAVTIRNLIRLVAASNNDWVVPAGLDERRFAVFDVAGNRQQDRTYFGAIEEQMQNGGLGALLHHLLYFDLSTVDVGKAPDTAALAENKLLTASPVVKWWHNVLHEGRLAPGVTGREPIVQTRDLWNSFKEYAADLRHCQAKEVMVIFGNELRVVCPGVIRTKSRVCGEPVRVYKFPPLENCITDFVAATGIPVERPDPDDQCGGDAEWPPDPNF